MNQIEKAERFGALHVKGSPLVLYNAWDAGTARAIADAGAGAIATSSWAMAAAHGYEDGEAIPVQLVEQIVARITATIDLPVTVDFEGGYTDDDDILAANVSRLVNLGIIGINFEDRVVRGTGLYGVERQAQRIIAIRRMADERGIPLFINARTDLFLGADDDPPSLMDAAKERAAAYAAAGASGFFVPGLRNDDLIGEICAACSLPVNVMVMPGVSPTARLAELGVARISFGPTPYVSALEAVKAAARDASSSQDAPTVTPREVAERYLNAVRGFHAAPNSPDTLAAIVELFDEEIDWDIPGDLQNVPWIGSRRGRAGVAAFFRELAGRLEPRGFALRSILADGEEVSIIGELASLVKQTGKLIETPFVLLLTVRNEKIVRYRMLEDSFAASQAAGTALPPEVDRGSRSR